MTQAELRRLDAESDKYLARGSTLADFPLPPDFLPRAHDKALDVGCGGGNYMGIYRQVTTRVFGVDFSDRMTRAAARHGNVLQGDVQELPVKDGVFDYTSSHLVINHVPDTYGALAELARVTKNGGRLVVVVPNRLSVLAAMRAVMMQLGRYPLGPCRHYAAATLGAEGQGLGLLVVRACAIPKIPTATQPLRKVAYWIGYLLDEAVRRVYGLWGGDLAVLFEKRGAGGRAFMCGICGIAGAGADRALVERMNVSLTHRGPDGEGFYESDGVVLGHRRLRIIDLVTGDQPMSNEDGTVWAVYNGEIYNFQDLRCELENQGHTFRSASDTEVLVHLYEQHGESFLPKLDGIFAFALWDCRLRRLLLARDYFGVKPLHYHFDGHSLRFGSEVKAILQDPAVPRAVDFQALHYFLNLRFIPGERTLFAGIRRLLPAHYLIFENGTVRVHRYFELQPENGPRRHESHYVDGIRHHLRAAVRKQLISDVPLGVYLSGGLDSSSIVAFMSELVSEPVKTFCLGFNEPTDELDDARVVARHFATDHHEIRLEADPLRRYAEVIWHAEEPKENILQGFLLAQFARQHVTVVHGGLGGDELFAGYDHNRYIYPTQALHRLVPNSVAKHVLQPLSRLMFRLENARGRLSLDEYRRGVQMLLALGDPERYYLILRNTWDYDAGAFGNLYGPAWRDQRVQPTRTEFDRYFGGDDHGTLDQVLWAEFHTKLIDDYLMNEDRTSMAHGLEVRVPFLDRDLVRFAMGIPVDLKIKRNETKYIFRKAMTGLLPERVLRKKKWGFSFNPYHQFQKDLKQVAERILTRHRVEQRGWFNYTYLRRILDHPPHPRLRWHYFVLWLALGLEIWAQMFLDGSVAARPLDLEAYQDRPSL